LWLAVLKYAQDYAQKLGDSDALAEYTRLYDKSFEVINRDADKGGLWAGSFYTTQWYDGRDDRHVQEDQFVGPLFGVVPEDRVKSIYDALEPNMTEWGVRDTYPYREPFNNVGGDYHNGGVWVFLNFGDAFSRFVTGYPQRGYDILRSVGEWDLEKWGDYMPAEYLNGNNGTNQGKPIQGWSADFYAAVLHGIYGVEMLDKSKAQIMPRVADTKAFDTLITLSKGVIELKQTPSADGVKIELKSRIDEDIAVRYGAMTSRTCEGCVSEQIGECEFGVTEFTLAAGETHVLEFK
jgi:glycogen debranching enzyme